MAHAATNQNTALVPTSELRPIKPPVRLPGEWAGLWWTLAGAVVALGLLGWWLRLRRKAAAIASVPIVPPHVRARQKLAEALFFISEPDRFCTAVSHTLRIYLEERFRLHAPERTTEEFLLELQASAALNETQKKSLQHFLQSCDLVKFARLEPAESVLRDLHESALRLVDETQFDNAPLNEASTVPTPPLSPPPPPSPPTPPPMSTQADVVSPAAVSAASSSQVPPSPPASSTTAVEHSSPPPPPAISR